MIRVYVRREKMETDGADIIFDIGKNLLIGEKEFRLAYKNITSLESDLLVIGASVFASDRVVARGEREDFTRGIELSIPVVNTGLLKSLEREIEQILRILSNDSWRINLRQENGKAEKQFPKLATAGKTLLFSGGLDSLAAAHEFGVEGLQLVSHITRNQPTSNAQKQLVQVLRSEGIALPHFQFYVSSKAGKPNADLDHDTENTQRTRSFMFLILGGLMARRAGHQEVMLLAENGQMAIHLPLTQARIGAFSTHTAHPDVLAQMEKFLQSVLRIPIRINNPYVAKTKSEVVSGLCKRLPDVVPISTSCWKNTRLAPPFTHCGTCIPCIIRHVALSLHIQDQTAYARAPWAEDIAALPPDDDARRNLMDLCEFCSRFERLSAMELMHEWPELYSKNLNSEHIIQMYKRAAHETRTVLGRYPGTGFMLS